MKKLLQLIMLLIFLALFLTGCNSKQENEALSGGFGEPSPDIWIGYYSDKSTIKKNEDLTLKVYYGTSKSYPDDYIKELEKDDVSPDEILVYLVISYRKCTKDLIQKGEYTYTQPEYTINSTVIGEKVYKTIDEFDSELYPMLGKDSQYEEIVLTSDLFTEEMGYIGFAIKIYGVYQGVIDYDNSPGVGTGLYYKIDNDDILLYDRYYKFRKSIIK